MTTDKTENIISRPSKEKIKPQIHNLY